MVEAIERLNPAEDCALLVAIDGCGNSGKSTLAHSIVRLLPGANVVHFDDFYRPMPDEVRQGLSPSEGYDLFFDWQRLRDQVLELVRQGQPFRYQRFDWSTGRLAQWIDVEGRGPIIVEGVYATRPQLRDFYDLTVFVNTSRAECMRRAIKRGENETHEINRWRASEDWYLKHCDPATYSDLVVSGE